LEQQGNQGLQVTLPKRLNERAQKLAIDLVLIPYYGDEATRGIYRSQAKRSTTKFFCYASAYVIKKNKRTTVCFIFVQPDDTLLEVLTRLLERVEYQGIRLKRLYLDRQFAQVDVLQYLALQPYVSVVAIPKKGRTIKALQRGKKKLSNPLHHEKRKIWPHHLSLMDGLSLPKGTGQTPRRSVSVFRGSGTLPEQRASNCRGVPPSLRHRNQLPHYESSTGQDDFQESRNKTLAGSDSVSSDQCLGVVQVESLAHMEASTEKKAQPHARYLLSFYR
jgi:hypothetical protein